MKRKKISEEKVWQRARNPDQQKERRRAILDAAYRQFRNQDCLEVSLNAIAREAKLSKPSIYLYYTTREEIFLGIFMEAFQKWVFDTLQVWSQFTPDVSPRDVAAAWVNTAWTSEPMRVLVPPLQGVIEHHVSEDRLGASVRLKMSECRRLHQALQRLNIQISEPDLLDLMIYTLHLFGQFVLIENNKCLSRLLDKPEYATTPHAFQEMVTRAVTILLEGMTHKNV